MSENIQIPVFMNKEKEKKAGLSESFIIGVLALVFLLTGYQTALFVHRAAVTQIAANRDEPDTVYVYQDSVTSPQPQPQPQSQSHPQSHLSVRRNATHSSCAQAVRTNIPQKKVESFYFDPNTVSVEGLCRLGFSIKQAESIDNYRRKGGVFRRKEDFAKSYVVADSVYRRLEAYIDIPLIDLNDAGVEELDALPGIGEWYAKKIVEYRNELHGYSFKEQLLDIYKFDQDKYDRLSDLIIVRRPYSFPLWELSADSLRRHPYIRDMETAHSIVLFRDNNPRELWKVENLCSAGILPKKDADRLERCVL